MQIQRPTITNFDAATSGSIKSFSFLPTYNQVTSTAANTDIFLNRTETALGSGAQLLMDLQVGTVSKFSISNAGAVTGLSFSGTAAGLSATLVIASGGTNGTASPTAGGSAYGSGTAYAFTSAGTAGQVLTSNAASAPTWGAVDGGTF
jgi:hypothetical protein